METLSAEQHLDKGMSHLRQVYWRECRGMPEELRDAIKDGEISDREALIDRIHEDCDSTQQVIYTVKAQLVLLVSSNESAGVDDLGADGFDWSAGIPRSQLAYFAIQADLQERLDALDVDYNADDLGREDADESEGA